ncbi:hypothetical protein DFJ43DRAFT_1068562 [Lentinula guzmanii]|uniref:Telomere-associated protein Rif1 N-terminal domain-containing protein n=1 Tax=Lentinula guzmanii TaxID=2804957 RepID=A0AA38JJG4_9AGAR|nr:hypothetical protein DFJ43DRAFT_1068562 [Lentinula guzmanii]
MTGSSSITISLPTPPATSHREKENRTLEAGPRGVIFSKEPQVHSLSTPRQGPSCCSALQSRPVKREETPEPSNPLDDSSYLQTPISTIISEEATLSDLIRAYSVLTARIRPYVNEWTNHSSPLFESLRANRDILCKRIYRDTQRALEDALAEEEKSQTGHQLPSPTKSPKKRRGYARDLCNISHSVLKFLGLLFSLPNVSLIFTDLQLTEMLSGILSIPLASDLPTPNARKTYALSIYVIQSLRLKDTVLLPAKDRIAYALGRGLDGELGKEGKKGSASDGLKAIHDLSIYQPVTFVPAFVVLTESILRNLLAPTLTLRVQACHALGGLAQGIISIPRSTIHSRISLQVVNFLLSPTTSPKKGSPVAATQESDICRTLRTTLNAEDFVHVAQGPVWALHVLGSFIVLIGSAFKTNMRVVRTITNLLTLTMRHKKVVVRKLACVVWRSITWSWHQHRLPSLDGEDEMHSKVERQEGSQKQWALIELVLNMGVGVGTCYAIIGEELGSAERIRLERILTLMVNKGDDSRDCALRCIKQLVSLDQQASSWDIDNLLSKTFLSGLPGILNADSQDLAKSLQLILEELPHVHNLRPLNRDELLELDTMGLFLELWSSAIGMRNGQHNNEVSQIHSCPHKILSEGEDDEVGSKAARNLASTLYDSLRIGPREESKTTEPRSVKQEQYFDLAKNLRMVRRAWTSLCDVLAIDVLAEYGPQLLARLVQFEDELGEIDDGVRQEWAALCVDLILYSEESSKALSLFWNQVDSKWNWSAAVRTTVWTRFIQTWQQSKQSTWDGSLILLSAPFCSGSAWDLNNEELATWERFLAYIVNKGLDYGYDCVAVVSLIAEKLQEKCNPTFTSLARIADMLMTHALDSFREITALPESLVDFIADTLNQSYPPSPSTGFSSLWMIRSLGHLIDACPEQFCLDLLESLQDFIALWISDEQSAVMDTYDDLITFYENLLMRLGDVVPSTQEYMQRFAPILDAIFIGAPKPQAAFDAFDTFWHTTQFSTKVRPQAWPKKVYEYIYGAPGVACAPLSPAEESEAAEQDIGCNPGSEEQGIKETEFHSDSRSSLSHSVNWSSPALEFPASPSSSELGESEAKSPEIDISCLLPASPILSTPPRASKSKTPTAATSYSFPPLPRTPGGSGSPSALKLVRLFSPETPSGSSRLVPSPIIKSLPPVGPPGSPHKRRRVSDSDKENVSPSPCSARSPSYHRGHDDQGSPSRCLSADSRKRLFDGVEERAPGLQYEMEKDRPMKRVRISRPIPPLVLPVPTEPTTKFGPASLEAADFDLLSSASSSAAESSRSSPSSDTSSQHSAACTNGTPTLHRTLHRSRKRKSLFLDYVEVSPPNLIPDHRVTGPSTEAREMKTPTNRISRTRKRKSLTMLSPIQGRDAEGELDPDFQKSVSEEILDIPSESDSDYGSDSGLGSSARTAQKQLSSDDDPHLGQVTPGHLISPALRRLRERNIDDDGEEDLLSSDDSDCFLFGGGGAVNPGRLRELSPSREVRDGTGQAAVTPSKCSSHPFVV